MSVILVDLPDGLRDDTSERLRQIIAAINGYSGQGIQWNLTAYSSDSKYHQQLRNLGTDGLHWAVYHSGSTLSTDSPIVEVQDAGLFVTDTDFRVYHGLNVVLNVDSGGVVVGTGYPTTLGGGLGVTGDITATDDISAGGTLSADDGLDVIAGPGGFGAIISGSVELNGPVDVNSTLDVTGAIVGLSTVTGTQLVSTIISGTPPLVVSSTTVVTNLNADLLDGNHATAFAAAVHSHTHSHDSDYLNEGGDTTSGDYTFSGSIDVGTDLAVAGELSVDGNTTLGNGLTDVVTIAGNTSVGKDLSVTGELTVNGNVTLGNANTDTVTMKGPLYTEESNYLGNGATDQTTITGEVLFKGGVSAGVMVAKPTNVAVPGLEWYDNGGTKVMTINQSASSYQLEVYGDSWVSGEFQVDGNVSLGNGLTDATRVYGTLQVDANATFNGQAAFNDPVTVSDYLDVVGTSIRLNTAYIDFDLGSTAGATHSGWDGYISVKHDGNTVKIPYITGAW